MFRDDGGSVIDLDPHDVEITIFQVG